MNIIYCINDYAGFHGAGATNALRLLISVNKDLERYQILCKNYILREGKKEDDVIEACGADVVNEFEKGDYLCVHWIRSNKYDLFQEIVHEMNRRKVRIPIITTVCQKPSWRESLITPIEIKNSSLFIFIDKTSYCDPFYTFIPKERKKMIRFGGYDSENVQFYDEMISQKQNRGDDYIIYGRGGSLNKCPKDMFEVYDQINSPKKIVIIGDGEDGWIKKEIIRRKDDYEIDLKSSMSYTDWLLQVMEFDVFLYYLPQMAYSSTDGTMLDAMMLKKPVVYCGPEAPKEFLIDGYNARIARSKEELSTICNELAQNASERKMLGENARKTVMENMNVETLKNAYSQVYKTIVYQRPLAIPLSFKWWYYGVIYQDKFGILYRDWSYKMKVKIYGCYLIIKRLLK